MRRAPAAASGFAGTSAASPGIAGAAALLLQQNPALTPTTLQAKVTSLAVDLGTAGPDNLFGAGRLLLPTLPVNTVLPTITGDGHGRRDADRRSGYLDGLADVHVPVAPLRSRPVRTAPPAAATATYLLVTADTGKTIRVDVTGTNGAGSGSATSAPVGVPGPPSNLTPPSISGTTQTGSTLTAATGSWLGFPVPDVHVPAGAPQRAGSRVHGHRARERFDLRPGRARFGLTLRVKVGASNTGGVAVPVESAATAVITAPPSAVAAAAGRRRRRRRRSNDLVVTATVDRTSASVGGSYVWRINVTNAGGGIAFGVNVDVAMSANLVYGFSQVNRGNGCTPAATAGHYTCNLDILGRRGPVRRWV